MDGSLILGVAIFIWNIGWQTALSIDPKPKPERIFPVNPGLRGAGLAPYAVDPRASRGRLVPEPPCPTRSLYARDRDRILHSAAFRRLNYKTQVFVYHEGDHYRSRLTHSLEVAQIARALAHTLRVDADLTEALALAHDLGHPPFGHAGERALDAAMSGAGGFDHNAQSLRVVTDLERKYAGFDGLNLTWETLEGLVKHNGPLLGPRSKEKPVPEPILAYCAKQDLELATFASVEAQIAALADDIAYNNHDIDDGYRAGLFTFDDLAAVPLVARVLEEVRAVHPGISGPRLLYETIRRLISTMIADVAAESTRRLEALAPRSADDVRRASQPVVAFSDAMRQEIDELRAFLFSRVYREGRVVRIMDAAEGVVGDLFRRYLDDPATLPPEWQDQAPDTGTPAHARHVADFIAGMTDRYALAEHAHLFDATPDLR
ncbi:MAG: deoxyguanosinetriphosphate triphosphohydrolase [Alphaproteobacteria bacterium]|nr:deoxyguanosinetriphosphate triphosphohydrolase [Alphaproteobacteria bacterium]